MSITPTYNQLILSEEAQTSSSKNESIEIEFAE